MEFVIYFFISWLVVSIYVVAKKNLHFIESTFTYLLILIISVHYSWIIVDELEYVSVVKKTLPYLAFLLNRSIIIPFFILLILNIVVGTTNLLHKALFIFLFMLIFVSLSYLSTRLHITEYKHWSLWYEGIYYLSLVILSFFTYKLFKSLSHYQQVQN